jgi:8-oxo-dGTP diphosphatase
MRPTHCYDWPRPAVTTDIVVLATRDGVRSILLIRRKGAPFAGSWALPGGFLEPDETLAAGAARELREETGVTLAADALGQVGAYGDPGRDPRGWTVSVAFRAEVDAAEATAGDDAAEVGWFAVDALPALAFDHGRIIADALRA